MEKNQQQQQNQNSLSNGENGTVNFGLTSEHDK